MKRIAIVAAIVVAFAAVLYHQGYLMPGHSVADNAHVKVVKSKVRDEPAPAVSVARVRLVKLFENVLVTGTLVPRLEIIISPEVEGLRVLELLVDEGDRVTRGQTLAKLEQETLKVQLAQNDAALAKSAAAIAQARSSITSADARRVETSNALDRARPLKQSGVVSDSTLDQRESAARTAVATLALAEDGLVLSQAEQAQVQAQRRDIEWRLSKTDVKAPADGLISRRSSRIGGMATGASVAEPMFRMISDSQIELEGEVPETDLVRLQAGQTATITIAGGAEVTGKIRLVSPEVDKATRQGKVRIGLGDNPALRIGSFGRGRVATRSSEGLTIPASALLYGSEGPVVQLVVDGLIVTRKVVLGLSSGELVEIRSGLTDSDVVVAKSGTFLRAGDRVEAVPLGEAVTKIN